MVNMESLFFWIGTIVFVGTYVLIASEKVHKTVAALLGASLMMLFILPGPSHSEEGHDLQVNSIAEQTTSSDTVVGVASSGSEVKSSEQSKKIDTEAIDQLSAPDKSKSKASQTISMMLEKVSKYDKLDTFARYSNFDVVFTLAGMMLLVNLLSGTGLFQYIAIKCAKLAKGLPVRTMILLVLATAVLSAFLDNVTTILLVAPVTLLVTNELGVPPVPFLMAETMASNIGGTATLIGDPPNLIIGSVAQLDFAAFLINLAWFIGIVLVVYCICLWCYYSKRMKVTVEKRALIMELNEEAAITNRHNLRRGGIVMLLTIVGFLLHGLVGLQPCVVAMTGAALALLLCKVDVDHSLEKIEWSTLFFFMALFILVCGAEQCGLMAKIENVLKLMNGWSVLAIVLTIMWGSAIAAAVMNNVSFTAAMVTVVASYISATPVFSNCIEYQHLMWWGLSLAICLGGNASLVGAAANLVTVGIAEKNGYKVNFTQFLTYGVPVTFGSMVLASIYIIVRYYLTCPGL